MAVIIRLLTWRNMDINLTVLALLVTKRVVLLDRWKGGFLLLNLEGTS